MSIPSTYGSSFEKITTFPIEEHPSLSIKEARTVALPPVGWGNGEERSLSLLLIETSDGFLGIGSAYTGQESLNRAWSMIRPIIDGGTADPQSVSNRLQNLLLSVPSHEQLGLSAAISAVDLALYDLAGKRTGKPVHQLLGNHSSHRVLAYCSLELNLPQEGGDQKFREALEGALKQGFKAIKIYMPEFSYRHSGRTMSEWDQYERWVLKYARDIVGSETLLMIDVYGSNPAWTQDLAWAEKIAGYLEEYSYIWFEEPLSAHALDDYASLRRKMKHIKISGGEHLYLKNDFFYWIDSGAVDIIQPDTTVAGGLSSLVSIQRAAETRGIQVVPHGWNTGVGLAADLHFMSSLPPSNLNLVEFKPSPHIVDLVCGHPFALDYEGMLSVPQSPGLGIELNWNYINQSLGCESKAG